MTPPTDWSSGEDARMAEYRGEGKYDMDHSEWKAGVLREYDYAAEWCARRGISGKVGDPLPDLLSSWCCDMIDADPEAFEQRVKDTAYMLARECSDG